MIKLRDVGKIYKTSSGEVCALKHISLDIYEGEYVAIVGKSGSGKSTLLNLLGTLDIPTSGDLFIDDYNLSQINAKDKSHLRNKSIGFIFQKFNLEAEYTVLQNVELPLLVSNKFSNKEKISNLLETFDLKDKINTKAKFLSGGEQQRVAIARAIVNNPAIILADEPCGNLDTENGQIVMSILKKLNEDGKTVILVTHDDVDAHQAKRIVTLSNGELIKDEKNT